MSPSFSAESKENQMTPWANSRNSPWEGAWLPRTCREDEEWGGGVMSAGHGARTGTVHASAPSLAQEEGWQGCTCIPGAVGHDLVHLVGLGDVQLASLGHLLEVGALVEGAAETRLPGGGVGLVCPLVVLPLVDGPSLLGRGCPALWGQPVSWLPAPLSKGAHWGTSSLGLGGGQWGAGAVCPGGLQRDGWWGS